MYPHPEIDQAIAKARQAGFTIKPHLFYKTETMECCPIGALDYHGNLLALPMAFTAGFEQGFDGIPIRESDKVSWRDCMDLYLSGFNMGQAYRYMLV